MQTAEELDTSVQNSNSSYDGSVGVREHLLEGNVVSRLPSSNSQSDPLSDKSKSVHVQKKGSNDCENLSVKGSSSRFLKWRSVVQKINESDILSVQKCNIIEEIRKKLSEK